MLPSSAATLTAATTSPTKQTDALSAVLESAGSSVYESAVSSPAPRVGTRSRKLTQNPQPVKDFAAERETLINQALDLQETVKGLIERVETARKDHCNITAENAMLLKYINNLMAAGK
ncbi:hypothetical protein BC830DRAFT_1111093 [Chytriomyces sp. MP71]|nr:hypothetical protein BC830DRAFT_1111093 [Chytriomyces sp. MP71]